MHKLIERMVLPQLQVINGVCVHDAVQGVDGSHLHLCLAQQKIVTEASMDHNKWLQRPVSADVVPQFAETLLFVHLWASATYGLFGDAMLSLRHVYHGSAILWPLHNNAYG